MRKLRLDFNALQVESLEAGSASGQGTVRGHTGGLCVEGNQSWDGGCGGAGDTCSCDPACNTALQSCPPTCMPSCVPGSCWHTDGCGTCGPECNTCNFTNCRVMPYSTC